MEIFIRDYRPQDSAQLAGIFRDSYRTLKKSKGGRHPDQDVERLLERPDREIISMLERGSHLVVAEVRETGELAGMAGFTTNIVSRVLNSTYSRNHYVKEAFQKGRAGVSVGSMLRSATMERARERGFRKIYGYSTPEAAGFHAKFGCKFVPRHNYQYLQGVEVHYYEAELRPSLLNRLPLEPYAAWGVRAYVRLREAAAALTGSKKRVGTA